MKRFTETITDEQLQMILALGNGDSAYVGSSLAELRADVDDMDEFAFYSDSDREGDTVCLVETYLRSGTPVHELWGPFGVHIHEMLETVSSDYSECEMLISQRYFSLLDEYKNISLRVVNDYHQFRNAKQSVNVPTKLAVNDAVEFEQLQFALKPNVFAELKQMHTEAFGKSDGLVAEISGKQTPAKIIVCVFNGSVVGYVVFDIDANLKKIELLYIVTKKSYRRHGFGSNLLKAVERHYVGYEIVLMQPVNHVAAYHFYLAQGFEMSGLYRHVLVRNAML